MSGDGKAYTAPVGCGEWTDVGYIADFEVGYPAAETCQPTWTDRSIEFTFDATHLPAESLQPTLRLDPGDGRDRPRLPDVSDVKLPPQPGEKIAAVTPAAYMLSGVYRRCDTCRAPAVSPFPEGWRLDLSREDGQTWLTPHRDTCTAPVVGAPLRAEYVHNLSLDLDAWSRGEPG